ncbi:sigma-54-dependent Fis family transcriptional regulator [Bacillus sp. AFS076308]|uniref:sigma-54 interaction domain-containing protein n=1 Tax=unclassified Bacillus (in: firmicutes) TaxID=185979 RepID=UPI000BF6B96A|nr:MULTISPECIES: sigma 54-interacting transcriptional regulator [unclassified Bacillus (in: firmicutes)]PFO06888.1 sigma-54-dependent Fis family transcriptional regulator [Bacillus sp. AFS076308]PGV55276.1 sigma-54-dependent Fis family transcriptional regulator [Bacillus sp. AFS037270]
MEKSKNDLVYLNGMYKRILDEIDVGVHAVDETGKTIIYNKKMMQIESMDFQDVMDKNLLDVFMFKDDQSSTLVKALQEGKETSNVKQTYFNNKGREITTINNTIPIYSDHELRGAVEIANDVTKLEKLIKGNMKKGTSKYTFDHIIGNSPAIKEVIKTARRATRTSSYVLIVGDTGTGKELFAQSIHNGSERLSGPFISQNCAALPDNLIESLLFGTKRGAFTGATDTPGLFEQANGGTLLLDEINSLNLNLQAKLLRVLQEKTIRRIGDTKDTTVDVRVIANMNEDPIDAVANNRMRKDLYYRLGVVTIFVPPLKDRKEDIPLLVEQFIEKYNERFQMQVKGLSEEVKLSFFEYDWHGNVRELEHIIEAAMNIMMDGEDFIMYRHLPYQYRNKMQMKERMMPLSTVDTFMKETGDVTVPLKEQLELFEKTYIEHVLKKNDFNISKTAKLLGLSRQSLQYRLKKLNFEVNSL